MRALSTITLILTTIAVGLVACTNKAEDSPQAQPDAPYQAGVHYRVIEEPVPVADPSKIEVVELFWYGCGSCFYFEPLVVEWKNTIADDVNFIRMPAMWAPIMEVHARVFYVADALDVVDDVHQAIFNAINIDKKRLASADEISNLFSLYGVEKDQVAGLFGSAEVTNNVQMANQRAQDYDIGGTPTIVIDGKYLIQQEENLVTHQDMIKITDYLINKIRTEKNK
ncbi:thiol:disulfide interchange protein DsbA/DsbL [Aurantivibrio infirmus]